MGSSKKELDKALFLACELERTNWISRLLEAGADPNSTRVDGRFGSSPLEISRNTASREELKLLLSSGATNSEWMPLHLAAMLDDANKIADLIGHGHDVNVKDRYGWSPLIYALHFRSGAAIQTLLRQGAQHTFNPMQASVLVNDLGSVRDLARDGRSVNLRNDRADFTPLMFSAMIDNEPAADILLRNGAEMEAQTASQGTALILAAKSRSHRVLKRLLASGADPNHLMSGCESALAYAVFRRDAVAVRMLLDAFANPVLASGNGMTPREIAKKMRLSEIEKMLSE